MAVPAAPTLSPGDAGAQTPKSLIEAQSATRPGR